VTISASAPSQIAVPPVLEEYISPSSVRISFVPPNSGYPIEEYVVTQSDQLGATTTYTVIGSLEKTLSGLTEGYDYQVSVAAKNAQGTGVDSDYLSFRFANTPSSPQSFTLESTDLEITAKWQPPTDNNGDFVQSYKVYLDNGFGGEPKLVHTASKEILEIMSYTTMLDGNRELIQYGRMYRGKVTASNTAGESDPAEQTIIVCNSPLPPYNIQVTDLSTTTVTITWVPPDNVG
jgi:hypothetical protein